MQSINKLRVIQKVLKIEIKVIVKIVYQLSVVIPGVITMGIVGLASIKGIQLACIPLMLIIAMVFFILKRTRNLD